MNRTLLALVFVASAASLAACGNSTGDRVVSGAGIGAGVGAVGGLMLGDPVDGALIGAAVGGGVGAATDKHQIDLGKPVWE